MKYILGLLLIASASFAFAHQDATVTSSQPEATKIYVEVDGALEPLLVDEEALWQIASDPFYECRPVNGGWRRCSKRTGRCFGAVFRVKRQCESVLNPDDD